MLSLALAAAILAAAPAATLDVVPREGTVGDPLTARLVIELPAGFTVEPGPVGPELGSDASVIEGTWQPASEQGKAIWSGKIAAYKPGRIEIPSIAVGVRGPEGPVTVNSAAVVLDIKSVLDA